MPVADTRRPVAIVLGGMGMAGRLRAAGVPCEIFDAVELGTPPAGFRAEIAVGGYGAPEGVVPWLDGVRWVHLTGAGTDNVPDEVFVDRVVTHSAGVNAFPVAEFAFATMLAFEKHLPASWVTEPPVRWARARLGTLEGRRLGIVGLGHIGTTLAAMARPFEMEIRATTGSQADGERGGVALTDLRSLFAWADHIVLAARGGPATRHMIDATVLADAKPGMHLVNIGRGSLVDEDALRVALDDGRIALASLDTVEREPLPAGHWLFRHPSVRLSPHVAYASPATGGRGVERFERNLLRYVDGEALGDVVTPQIDPRSTRLTVAD